jgi:hypothetical protein
MTAYELWSWDQQNCGWLAISQGTRKEMDALLNHQYELSREYNMINAAFYVSNKPPRSRPEDLGIEVVTAPEVRADQAVVTSPSGKYKRDDTMSESTAALSGKEGNSTVIYQRVTTYRRETGACPTCRRLTERTFSETMTVDASRRNPDGSVKTRGQVQAEIDAVADAWIHDFEHENCRKARGGLSPEEVSERVSGLGERPTAADIRQVLMAGGVRR